jgi:nucleoside triphosphate diphosphatase
VSPNMPGKPEKPYNMDSLLEIMRRLRDPEGGCPWDLAQNFESIAPYTIEEAYEVAEAISHKDYASLRDELGDLLFQAVYHAQMAHEAGHFSFKDVVDAVCDKMIRRHPHVFGDLTVADADAQSTLWEQQKAAERLQKAVMRDEEPSVLDDVPIGLPSLLRALKLQKRAAHIGFDWSDVGDVVNKLHEEIAELAEELAKRKGLDGQDNKEAIAEEFGDLMFVCANLARHLDLDPEEALRLANFKFERRFKGVEAGLRAKGIEPSEASLAQMEAEWLNIKNNEKTKG